MSSSHFLVTRLSSWKPSFTSSCQGAPAFCCPCVSFFVLLVVVFCFFLVCLGFFFFLGGGLSVCCFVLVLPK